MKNLSTILILAAVTGTAFWLFGTKGGRKVLNNIKDKSGDLSGTLKSGLNTVKETTANLVNKGKQYVTNANNAVQETI